MGWARTLLIALFALMAAVAPVGEASARSLFSTGCVLPAAETLTYEQARESSGWVCDPEKQDANPAHSWLRIPGNALPRGEVVLISDSMAMDGIEVVAVQPDGTAKRLTLDDRELASHWITGTRFAIPLDFGAAGVRELFIRADNPLGPEVLNSVKVQLSSTMLEERRLTMFVLGVIVGIMVLTVIASLLMAAALRFRFAWYHFAYSALLTVFLFASGSVVFLFAPDITLWQRSVISYAAMAWAISLVSPFALEFFERPAMTPTMRKLVIVSGILAFSAGFFLPLGAAIGVNLRPAYHMAFIPGILCTVVITGYGLVNQSRFAKAFMLVWTTPFVFLVERVVRNLGLYTLPVEFDFTLYGALAVEATAMTAAIGWRVHELRTDLDSAVADQTRLENEALHDPLTGLPNRRHYEGWTWANGEMLALLDLDRFKAINDGHGHAVGDAVLRTVADVLASAVADGSLIAAWRIGGEEFAVAIDRRQSLAESAIAFNLLRARISGAVARALPELRMRVTASAGMVECDGKSSSEFYRSADRLLYVAKLSGRDNLCYTQPDGSRIHAFAPARRAA